MKETQMINIDGKKIGDGQPTFITFEAGPTHNGVDSAIELVELTAKSGADAIKFQIFNPDELVSDKKQMYSYDVLLDRKTGEIETVTEPLYDIFVRRSMKDAEWKKVKKRADELGISFFATIGDQSGLKLIQELDCKSVKVASADVNYMPWLRQLSHLGISIQLDTGNSTFGEIEQAVDCIRSEGCRDIIIHNCPSGYPAHLSSINLKMLPALKNLFQCPVAYSDHSPGAAMDIAAVALGANLIEKTITMDKTTRSVEHIMSIEPDEMFEFVQTIRDVEIALGSSRRSMTEEQKLNRLNIRRSTILDENVSKGQRLNDVKVTFKRPGFGLPPDVYEQHLNSVFTKDLSKGTIITLKDLE